VALLHLPDCIIEHRHNNRGDDGSETTPEGKHACCRSHVAPPCTVQPGCAQLATILRVPASRIEAIARQSNLLLSTLHRHSIALAAATSSEYRIRTCSTRIIATGQEEPRTQLTDGKRQVIVSAEAPPSKFRLHGVVTVQHRDAQSRGPLAPSSHVHTHHDTPSSTVHVPKHRASAFNLKGQTFAQAKGAHSRRPFFYCA
jgi:hypothetical protein